MDQEEELQSSQVVVDRIAASLVGLAVGDALGAPVEGRSGDEVAIILTGSSNARHALRPDMAVDHWDEHCVRRLRRRPDRPGAGTSPHSFIYLFKI
jgi:hypothetical protein